MDIYVKARKKLDASKIPIVYLKDFADVVADQSVKQKVENINFPGVNTSQAAVYLISIADVVKAIINIYPNAHVINIGEKDTVVNCKAAKHIEGSFMARLKIAFVSLILLFGSATAIMSFYSDAGIGTVLENFYYMVFHIKSDKPLIVEIPYSIGIAVGIIAFFNHIAGRKVMEDPTPIEVEMVKYDNDVTDTLIERIEDVTAENGNKKRGIGK